jgi:uncharacterized protein YkwD
MQRLRTYWFIFVALAFASICALSNANAQSVSDEDETTLHFPEEDFLDAPSVSEAVSIPVAPARTPRPVVFQTAAPTSGDVSEVAALANYISAYRVQKNLPPVRLDPSLTRSAQYWSNQMAQVQRISHARGTSWRRGTSAVSENVGYGHPTALKQFEAWKNSPPHRADMLISNLHRIGVGLAVDSKNRKYWTADFGI